MRVLSILLLVIFLFPLYSVLGEDLPDYEPYEENEFPVWARDLRRAEIIFFGTIPFTFFISGFSYDIYRFVLNDFDPDSAPALFGNTTPPILTNEEKLQIIAVSVSLSSFLALLDYLLGEPWND